MSAVHDGPAPFAVDDLPMRDVAGVVVRGEIEIATAPVLTHAIEDAIRRTSGPFAVDLAAVDFLDSTGIHCLVRARALLGRDERALALVDPSPAVRRVLALAGLDELVPIYASRDELARGLTPAPGDNATA